MGAHCMARLRWKAVRAKAPTAAEHIVALANRSRRSVDDLTEQWHERSAIREYDGGQPRWLAESDALVDLRRMHEPQRSLV